MTHIQTQTPPLLQVDDLRVDVAGHSVLKSVSLQARAGQLIVVMGANGSGKSTMEPTCWP